MFKKLKERNIHFLLVAFLLGLFFGINVSFLASATEQSHKYLDYFHNVYQLITTEYVEEPNTKDIFYGAIRGMLRALDDPFSRFLDEKAYDDLREMTTGKFQGVGIEITVRDGDVVVVTPISDSPAMRAGVQSGDVIYRVNGKSVRGKKLEDIVKLIRGLPKSSVILSIKREGVDDLLNFELERAPVKIKSVEYTVMKEGNLGYLKIKNFGSDTTKDVTSALKELSKKNIKKLIIDLRYNPGGLLTSCIEISDLLLDRGKTIVSTRGRKGTGAEQFFNSKSNPIYGGKVLILVNRGTASAAEILSAAVRDNKRGILLGEKTFGKGSVQKSFNLDENIGVAITVAKYYTPAGTEIHKKGITPDITVSFDKVSEKEQENINRLTKKDLMKKFVTKGMNYDDGTRAGFRQFLRENGIELSDKTADFMLKEWIFRYRQRPLYDLEFDIQLQRAVNEIGEM